MRKPNSRTRRLCVWFFLNLIVFIVCYLNYLLQLKHRYLYRTLNVGLCLSRAAAMVINFNLLLVWLPMCKYSLTRLACLACNSLKHHRQTLVCHTNQSEICDTLPENDNKFNPTSLSRLSRLLEKFRLAACQASFRLNQLILTAKMNTITSFSIAVDHCKSLHTICATTITIASVIHTVAHLMNVVNFSRNYDPLLGNLNMAEYKGQSPFHLLISVPGITGTLMMIILALMSLSSVDLIRNSSYDLFQIFHRLSVLFVILLFIHPASHVIKEQSNVDRHHPEICYPMMVHNSSSSSRYDTIRQFNDTSSISHQLLNMTMTPLKNKRAIIDSSTTSPFTTKPRKPHVNNYSISHQDDLRVLNSIPNNQTSLKTLNTTSLHLKLNKLNQHNVSMKLHQPETNKTSSKVATTESSNWWHRFCIDERPLFVAQSSVCWYVLSVGLSCYLFDLIVRRLRRSNSSIELLEVRSDRENNLIELILSNNHKRFSYWQPGQFVYLNCPQIAVYQWHPFTISSMDHKLGHFTLHIKTVGDWTRKLREKLELARGPLSTFHQPLNFRLAEGCPMKSDSGGFYASNKLIPADWINQKSPSARSTVLPSLDCYNHEGTLQILCTKLVRVKYEEYSDQLFHQHLDEVRIDMSNQQQKELYTISEPKRLTMPCKDAVVSDGLDLYIDGPFHSPFERLLEQQVAVCIANGVGWTAFSSIFQYILNDMPATPNNYRFNLYDIKQSSQLSIVSSTTCSKEPRAVQHHPCHYSSSRLHLMVVVTSIEQLRPFYGITLDYFRQIQSYYDEELDTTTGTAHNDHLNPVKEITAFITRATALDITVKEFCEQENLNLVCDGHSEAVLRVNERFSIKFGKPKFDTYLKSCASSHIDSSKISVYCCGSYQVKKDVKRICKSMNRLALRRAGKVDKGSQFFSYHEENF